MLPAPLWRRSTWNEHPGRAIMSAMRICLSLLLLASLNAAVQAEDGYELWLRYQRVTDALLLSHYRAGVTALVLEGESPSLQKAGKFFLL